MKVSLSVRIIKVRARPGFQEASMSFEYYYRTGSMKSPGKPRSIENWALRLLRAHIIVTPTASIFRPELSARHLGVV